ncbi:MAG: TlpA family protein disulfide reductase [Arenimonas sp.]
MTLRPISLLLLLALAGCGAEQADAPATPAAQPVAAKPASSKQMPALTVETFQGDTFNLADHRGKWVVVNFWATWCAPCLKEIPDFNAFAKSRPDVQFIGLAYEEIERADMEAFLKDHPIDYPFAILDVYNPPADFDTPRGLPMTVLVAPDGKVAKTFLGPVTSADLAAAIGGA